MLHGHGDDSYTYKHKIVADFSTNIWLNGEPKGLKEHIFERWPSVNRYPEVLAESFREKLSQLHDVTTPQVLVCNGTAEAIYLIAHAFKQSTTTIAIPSFAEYEDACQLHDHQLEFTPWEELVTKEFFDSKLVFICNPNNPTGAVIGQDRLEAWLKANPETTFILDEAFIEFTKAISSAITLLKQYKNLVILRSLTKVFAIPGLRLGYVLGTEALIKKLESVKYPWSVNGLAIEAGKYIVDHYSNEYASINQLLNNKEVFAQQLQSIPYLEVYPSHTHFFLVKILRGTASQLKQYLVEQQGILIRDASNFRGLSKRHFRLATLAPQQNGLLIKALQTWTTYS